jgi:glycosyltransferase involved in cell wall biosynthesis
VAYVVSRFPRLTETFVTGEMAAVIREGIDVQLYPLHRERTATAQPDAEALADRVHVEGLASPSVLASQWRALRRDPRSYLAALGAIVHHNLGSHRLLVGAVASFPFAAHLGLRLEREGVDHVHAHFATHPAAVAYVIHRLTGIGYSFTAHGSDIHRDTHMLAEKARSARFVVAVSESNRTVVLDACRRAGVEVPAQRVIVVRCGVDPDAFPVQLRGLRSVGDPLHVLAVGTLHAVKGQRILVEACRRARLEGVDVRLTFVGDGPDRRDLQRQVDTAGLGEVVTFVGAVTQPHVRRLLGEADLLAVPSVPTADGRREGLPVVIVEAMASGVPVVASRLSGIPEIVDHQRTGLLVAPGDPEALAAALLRIERDPQEAARFATAAHRLVRDQFDAQACARQLADRFRGEA